MHKYSGEHFFFGGWGVHRERGNWDCSVSAGKGKRKRERARERRERERERERESQNKKKLGYSKHFGVFSL